MFYLSNNSSTMRYLVSELELYVRYYQQVMTSNTHCNPLRYIFVVLILITQKVQVINGRSTYRTTALLLEMTIFCVGAGYEIQLVSYDSKHA